METKVENNTAQEQEKDSSMAVIAYITIIGLLIAYINNKDKNIPLVNYHLKQSMGLACCGLAIGVVNIIPILGWIVSFFGMFILLYLWIRGLMNAINKKETPVPFFGKNFENWFRNI